MTMKHTSRIVALGIVGVMAAGCASKTDLYMLQDDVKELKTQSQQSGGQNAQVYSEVEQLREQVARLQGTIEELRFKLGEPEQPGVTSGDLSLLSSDTTASSQSLEKVTLPADPEGTSSVADPGVSDTEASSASAVDDQGLYDTGVRYFESYNYSSARKELGLLLDNYPSSPLADDAQYYIAETYYNEKWFEKAILEYQLVIEKYPEGDKRPSAYFKQGLAFENIGDSTNAKVRYKELVQLYPNSNEAKIVDRKLQ